MKQSQSKRTEKFDRLVTRYEAYAHEANEEGIADSRRAYYQGILVGIKLSAFDTLSTVEFCKFMDEVHKIDDSFLGWGGS